MLVRHNVIFMELEESLNLNITKEKVSKNNHLKISIFIYFQYFIQ